MEVTNNDLEQRYKSLSTDELIELRATNTLTDIAKSILCKVLEERGVAADEQDILTKEFNGELTYVKQHPTLGTKWICFCAYFQYPIGGIGAVSTALNVPISEFTKAIIISAPFALIFFIIAFGLHKRKLLAWKANWVVLALGCLGFIYEQSAKELIALLITAIAIIVFAWLNYIYWTKRRYMFT